MSGPWLYDRVRETTTTTGTGTLSLAGAVSGWRSFTSVLSNSDTVYYSVSHQTLAEYEWGIGTFTTSGTTLARTTVLGGSNGTSAVNFSAGTKDVFIAPLTTLMGDRLPEISVTGTATATIDRMHVCSGTSADYTVTLPVASGNAGRRVWFRMAPLASLSKLVTLDGNGGETIDGATTRVMWAGETCELWCDGSNWFKRAGKTIPLICGMLRNTTTSVSNATATKLGLNETVIDNQGTQADPTTNNRIDVKRSAVYEVVAKLAADAAAILSAQVRVNKNGSLVVNFPNDIPAFGGLGLPSAYLSFATGDYLELYAYQASGSSRTFYGAAGDTGCSLFIAEQPQW